MGYVHEGMKRVRYMVSFLMKRMVHLNLQILYRCNFRCRICDFWKEPYTERPDITLEHVRQIAGKLKELGPQIISIGGGEPLLHPELVGITRELARDNFPVMICNGWHVTRENAGALFNAGMHEVSISIDYADPKKHDAQRGIEGAYQRAVNGLKLLNENRTSPYQRVHLISVVMEDNLDEIEPLIHLAKEIGITYMVTLYSSGRGKKPDLTGKKEAADHLLKLRKKYPHFVSLPGYLAQFREPVSPCYAGKNLFNIDSQGNVTRCIDCLDEPVGNILTDDMKEIRKKMLEKHTHGGCDSCWTSCRGSIETLMYGKNRLYNTIKSYDITKKAALEKSKHTV
ncbi:MAG: radical SAM protein [bacterium]|nr:radical SAM protein [bacterium]